MPSEPLRLAGKRNKSNKSINHYGHNKKTNKQTQAFDKRSKFASSTRRIEEAAFSSKLTIKTNTCNFGVFIFSSFERDRFEVYGHGVVGRTRSDALRRENARKTAEETGRNSDQTQKHHASI